jgi:O-methyltransferase involved in polyketide biosynthesis
MTSSCWCTPVRCLTSTPEGACDYVDGDLRDPDKILAEAARTLDFTKPVALLLLGILHHIPDADEAYAVVRRLVAALAPGSYVAINHSTSAVHGEAMEDAVRHWNRVGKPSMTLRTPEQITRFFDGLDLLPPGVVSCSRWRPDPGDGPVSRTKWTNSAESRASREPAPRSRLHHF